jgi:hypothetical protein
LAQKSLANVINHRIEKLSTLLDSNQTQLDVQNTSEISIEPDDTINGTSTIKVNPLSIQKSK